MRQLGTPIPQQGFYKFKYADEHLVNYTAAAPADGFRLFYAANPYDPIPGLSLPKCSGFDQIMGLYRRGLCFAAKITTTWHAGNSDNVLSYGFIKLWPSANNEAIQFPPSANEIAENPVHTRYLTMDNVTNNDKYPKRLTYFMRTKRVEQKRELENILYGFTLNSGPQSNIRAQIGAIPVNTNASGFCRFNVLVKITYYCKVFDKQIIAY